MAFIAVVKYVSKCNWVVTVVIVTTVVLWSLLFIQSSHSFFEGNWKILSAKIKLPSYLTKGLVLFLLKPPMAIKILYIP